MDRFWQRLGNSNTTLSLSVPLSHIDTTNATEIPWYFFDASVVYPNPHCQKPCPIGQKKNLQFLQYPMWAADKNQVLIIKKSLASITLCLPRLNNVYTNCFHTRH